MSSSADMDGLGFMGFVVVKARYSPNANLPAAVEQTLACTIEANLHAVGWFCAAVGNRESGMAQEGAAESPKGHRPSAGQFYGLAFRARQAHARIVAARRRGYSHDRQTRP